MSKNRTLATLLVKDSSTNEDETLLLVISLPQNQTARLAVYVNTFCLQKNMTLLTIPNISPEFQPWEDRVGAGETQCTACNQSFLQSIPNNEERFCSNFCRRTVNNEPSEE